MLGPPKFTSCTGIIITDATGGDENSCWLHLCPHGAPAAGQPGRASPAAQLVTLVALKKQYGMQLPCTNHVSYVVCVTFRCVADWSIPLLRQYGHWRAMQCHTLITGFVVLTRTGLAIGAAARSACRACWQHGQRWDVALHPITQSMVRGGG